MAISPAAIPPAASEGKVSTPAVVPVVPPQPPAAEKRLRWPWVVLMVIGGFLALGFLFFSCIGLLAPEEFADQDLSVSEVRWVFALCCLVPGILFAVAATWGGVQAFRRR